MLYLKMYLTPRANVVIIRKAGFHIIRRQAAIPATEHRQPFDPYGYMETRCQIFGT